MSDRHLLVVATAAVDDATLREQVRRHGGEHAHVRIVAPAADVSPLQWLVSDEDHARAEAKEVAEESIGAVEGVADEVEAVVGDSDPVQAIEDALRTFPADEIVLVTHEDDEAGWLEEGSGPAAMERFGLPVTHLTVDGG